MGVMVKRAPAYCTLRLPSRPPMRVLSKPPSPLFATGPMPSGSGRPARRKRIRQKRWSTFMARAIARWAGSESAPSLIPGAMKRHSRSSSGSTSSMGTGVPSLILTRSRRVTGSRLETIRLNSS